MARCGCQSFMRWQARAIAATKGVCVCVCVESSDWLKSDQGCVGGARLRHESFQRSRVVVAYDEEKQDKAEEKHMSSRRKD